MEASRAAEAAATILISVMAEASLKEVEVEDLGEAGSAAEDLVEEDSGKEEEEESWSRHKQPARAKQSHRRAAGQDYYTGGATTSGVRSTSWRCRRSSSGRGI